MLLYNCSLSHITIEVKLTAQDITSSRWRQNRIIFSNTVEKFSRFIKTIRHSMVAAEVCLSIMTTLFLIDLCTRSVLLFWYYDDTIKFSAKKKTKRGLLLGNDRR